MIIWECSSPAPTMVMLGYIQWSPHLRWTKFVVIFLGISPLVCRRLKTCNFRKVPPSITSASYSWHMPLNEAIFAVVSNHGIYFISWFCLSKSLCIFNQRRLSTGNCSLFAGVCEMIVAWHIIPLPILMPNYYNTIFTSRKEAVWLVRSPVFILQRASISPAEIMLKHLIVQANPLIIMTQAVYKVLFVLGQNAG